jgi:hypothetical protein
MKRSARVLCAVLVLTGGVLATGWSHATVRSFGTVAHGAADPGARTLSAAGVPDGSGGPDDIIDWCRITRICPLD